MTTLYVKQTEKTFMFTEKLNQQSQSRSLLLYGKNISSFVFNKSFQVEFLLKTSD